MEGPMMGCDLFTEINACLNMLGLKWNKLAGVETDGRNLIGKNLGPLKPVQDKVAEMNPAQILVFLYFIIH